jgi:prophage maintenance system killer protein
LPGTRENLFHSRIENALPTARLAERFEDQHRVVDAALVTPARWRGRMRRDGIHAQPGDGARYAKAYEVLVQRAASPDWQLGSDDVLTAHDLVAGGREFRSVGVNVGPHRNFLHSQHVPPAIDRVIQEHARSVEPACIAAIRLHLKVLTVHPFTDGNGRTARLLASMCLAHAGYKSTLLVALEEVASLECRAYIASLDDYWIGTISEDCCVERITAMLVRRSAGVAAVRMRERFLRALCRDLGIPRKAEDEALWAVESLNIGSPREWALLRALRDAGEAPWAEIQDTMPALERECLAAQLERLMQEEASQEGLKAGA